MVPAGRMPTTNPSGPSPILTDSDIYPLVSQHDRAPRHPEQKATIRCHKKKLPTRSSFPPKKTSKTTPKAIHLEWLQQRSAYSPMRRTAQKKTKNKNSNTAQWSKVPRTAVPATPPRKISPAAAAAAAALATHVERRPWYPLPHSRPSLRPRCGRRLA